MRNAVSPIMILMILFSSFVVFAPKGFADAPVISYVSPIAATNLQTIYIDGTGFGNTWPQTVGVGDGSVDTVNSNLTPYMDICDNGKYQKTGDPSDGGENWAAGVVGPNVFCMVGIYLTSWSDSEIVLGGFGTYLGTNGQGQWYIEPGDPLVVDVFTPSGQATYHTTVVGAPTLVPTVQSCDAFGTAKGTFEPSEDVYVIGSGFPPSEIFSVYIVSDVTWTDGMSIPARVPYTATTLSSDASGNIPPTIVWPHVLVPGTYDIVVDVNGNGKYNMGVDALTRFSVTGPHALAVSITPTSVTMDVGQSQLFTSSVTGGNAPYAYQWYLDGALVSGATNSTWTFTPIGSASHEIHSVYVKVTDAASVVATSITVQVDVYSPPSSVTISPSSVHINLGESILFTSVTLDGAWPFRFQWYLNDDPVPSATDGTWTFTPASSGSYTVYVKVTDSASAIKTSNIADVQVVSTFCPAINGFSFDNYGLLPGCHAYTLEEIISKVSSEFPPELQSAANVVLNCLFLKYTTTHLLGHCYGISHASVEYYYNPQSLPPPYPYASKITKYDESPEVLQTIELGHSMQLNIGQIAEYCYYRLIDNDALALQGQIATIISLLHQGFPVCVDMHGISSKGEGFHEVVAYDYSIVGTETWIKFYDSNPGIPRHDRTMKFGPASGGGMQIIDDGDPNVSWDFVCMCDDSKSADPVNTRSELLAICANINKLTDWLRSKLSDVWDSLVQFAKDDVELFSQFLNWLWNNARDLYDKLVGLLPTTLTINLGSYANLYVTDPVGRHIGIDPNTQQTINEIPGATFSTSPEQTVSIPDPLTGNYDIRIYGTGTGPYTLTVEGEVNGAVVSSSSFTGTAKQGVVQGWTASISRATGQLTVTTTSNGPTPLTPPVGGEWVPIDKLQLLAPWLSVALTMAIAASFVGIRRKRKRQD